jgi:hypothetical protein
MLDAVRSGRRSACERICSSASSKTPLCALGHLRLSRAVAEAECTEDGFARAVEQHDERTDEPEERRERRGAKFGDRLGVVVGDPTGDELTHQDEQDGDTRHDDAQGGDLGGTGGHLEPLEQIPERHLELRSRVDTGQNGEEPRAELDGRDVGGRGVDERERRAGPPAAVFGVDGELRPPRGAEGDFGEGEETVSSGEDDEDGDNKDHVPLKSITPFVGASTIPWISARNY